MNPINPNKFISFKDQQSMGQLNDPLQTEQNFLANRMSQPVPVPEVQSPMMQTDYPHAGTKYNYKKGELVDTDDFNESTFNSSRKGGSISYPDIHTRDYSDVQEDSKGQYMTSLGSGEFFNDPKRPTSSTHDDFAGNIVERDTLRPNTGKKFASTFLPSAKNRDEAFKKFRNNN
jgi:hypothetical protein